MNKTLLNRIIYILFNNINYFFISVSGAFTRCAGRGVEFQWIKGSNPYTLFYIYSKEKQNFSIFFYEKNIEFVSFSELGI